MKHCGLICSNVVSSKTIRDSLFYLAENSPKMMFDCYRSYGRDEHNRMRGFIDKYGHEFIGTRVDNTHSVYKFQLKEDKNLILTYMFIKKGM